MRTRSEYVVDELLPQPTWPAGHQPRVDTLAAELTGLDGWRSVGIDDGTGILTCARLG